VNVSSEILLNLLASYLYPFIRISAIVSVAPIIGTRIVPVRTKIGLSIALTIIIVPLLDTVVFIEPFSVHGVLTIMTQILIGVMLGFMLRMVFSAVESGGQVIGMTMGLGFAQMNDPANGVIVPVISQFYVVLATLMFLA